MLINFSDLMSPVIVAVDENGVSFVDGKAYFSDIDGNDYMIDVNQINLIEGAWK